MKELISFGLGTVLLIACSYQGLRYTQRSQEIDTYKKVIEAYEERNWKYMISHYADTAKIMKNVTEREAQTLNELLAQNKKEATQFSSWDFAESESQYEMIINDKGETWVNFWGLWRGTLKENNKVYKIPTHITAQFVKGKIVREAGYWDFSKIVKDIQQSQAAEIEALEKKSENKTVSEGME